MQEANDEVKAGWVFKPDGGSTPPTEQPKKSHTPKHEDNRISWTASEYIANPKNANWFLILSLASIGIAVLVYLITKDWTSTIVIPILGFIIGVAAARQPRVLEYHVDDQGLYIAEKFYPYASFKSFSVAEDGAFSHISLTPLKRFMPPLAIHYSPEDEQKIVDTLADYLPYEEHKRDIVENFSRRIRF